MRQMMSGGFNGWFVILLCLCSATMLHAAEQKQPNVVIIMTDNHGEWTLGCYGNKDIQTPHIDQLAKEGTLFTRAFANNAVCSPTRASFLTGLMPCQHGVHCFLRTRIQTGPDSFNTLEEFPSIPQVLHDAGYVCGMSGKWHLGDNLYPQEGFSYWITKPHGGSSGFYDQNVIENEKIRKEPTYLTDLWTQHGVKFIKQNQEKPFFLFLAYNGPYGLAPAMSEPIKNRFKAEYEKKTFPSFPREKAQPWNFNYGDYIGDLGIIRKYAAEVSGIDDGVGQIMQTLKELGLRENTLVIFTADQGLAGGHSGYWGMGDHTRPLTAFDWTMSIPLIFSQPGKIEEGARPEMMVANYDVYPTLLNYLGLKDKIPAQPATPGRNFAPVLKGEQIPWSEVVFYEFENVRAIRTKDWKYIERFKETPNELYHLVPDPGERKNLIDDSKFSQQRQKLKQRMDRFFAKYADPKWDIWHGGQSKTVLMSKKLFPESYLYLPASK
ncbi:sulfatase-like hydrolase/transferase [uncultured Gimesia sp.]|uniref:sulfatase family protein n=1 Tax=uncultured Gimesia sp. TaxID=1678688 RepID=UPI00260EC9ED|nr:sulfatase-like hydrolase/transferase [uncultured Gimesia sp.]